MIIYTTETAPGTTLVIPEPPMCTVCNGPELDVGEEGITKAEAERQIAARFIAFAFSIFVETRDGLVEVPWLHEAVFVWAAEGWTLAEGPLPMFSD